MAQSILSRFNGARERLETFQDDLVHRRDDVCDRGAELRRQIEQRSTTAAGRLRDASLTTIYEFGASTLSTAAELTGKVPVVGSGAEGLRERAEALQSASRDVQRPPIDDYDDLNVRQVSEALDGLTVYELAKVREYEEANKDRVTVLRDVKRRIG